MEADTSELKGELRGGVHNAVEELQASGQELPSDEEQRKAAARAARLTLPPPDEHDYEALVPVGVGGQDGFFPAFDTRGAAIVAAAGGAANLIVVPDSFVMQTRNVAVFVRAQRQQRKFFAQMLNREAERTGNVDTTRLLAIMENMDRPVLLMKNQVLAQQDELGVLGTILHELGHLISPQETGEVFAHEVRTIRAVGMDEVREWLRREDSLRVPRWVYIARTSTDTGIAELIKELTDVLDEAELAEFKRIRDNKDKKEKK